MAVTSGTFANVALRTTDTATTSTKIIECTGWTMERPAVEGAYASNNTNGYRRRVTGTKDATGTITAIYDPDSPIEAQMQVGDRVYLQLHNKSTLGHKFYARITGGPNYGQDIQEGSVAAVTFNWGNDDSAPVYNTTIIAPS